MFKWTLGKPLFYSFSRKLKEPFMKIVPVPNPGLLRCPETQANHVPKPRQQTSSHSLIQVGVKISLTKKGCSGLGYTMDYIR